MNHFGREKSYLFHVGIFRNIFFSSIFFCCCCIISSRSKISNVFMCNINYLKMLHGSKLQLFQHIRYGCNWLSVLVFIFLFISCHFFHLHLNGNNVRKKTSSEITELVYIMFSCEHGRLGECYFVIIFFYIKLYFAYNIYISQ